MCIIIFGAAALWLQELCQAAGERDLGYSHNIRGHTLKGVR